MKQTEGSESIQYKTNLAKAINAEREIFIPYQWAKLILEMHIDLIGEAKEQKIGEMLSWFWVHYPDLKEEYIKVLKNWNMTFDESDKS